MLFVYRSTEPCSTRAREFMLAYYLRKQEIEVLIVPLDRICTSTAQTRLSLRIVKYRTVSAEHIPEIRRVIATSAFI